MKTAKRKMRFYITVVAEAISLLALLLAIYYGLALLCVAQYGLECR